MKEYILWSGILILFLYALSFCANIKPPTGGPRDTIPPILERSIPDNKSINFSGNSVKLFYNEYLKIENLNQQLIITPLIEAEFESKIRKFTVELIFPEPFEDSTTYTFNFQNAIQDITEGNVTLDNVLAFSTGTYIDSIYITGSVRDLLTDKPAENYTVCLYDSDDTLDIFNGKPIYLTRTDEDGLFRIENIKNGHYTIYTYLDNNNNLICDIPKEKFGFKKDSLNLNQNIDSIRMHVLYMDMRPLEISRDGPAGKYYEIKLNKNIVDYSIQVPDSNYKVFHNFGDDKRTIRFYNTFEKMDSLKYYFSAYDSLDQVVEDSLYLKFSETRRKIADFTYSINPKDGEGITDDFSARIIFNKPILSIHTDSIYFKYDSVTYQFIPQDSIHAVNDRLDEYIISMQLFLSEYLEKLAELDTGAQSDRRDLSVGGPGARTGKRRPFNLNFHIDRGTFISADLDTLGEIDYSYSKLKMENYGIIRGSVNSEHISYTIQLLDKQGLRKQGEIKNKKEYSFGQVKPGDYFIRVLIDNNNNGKWDPGNIFKNMEPEDVYFFPNVITVRANWEITDIILEF